MIVFSNTGAVRIFFINMGIICFLYMMIYTRMMIGVQREHLYRIVNIEDRNDFVVNLYQRDTLATILSKNKNNDKKNKIN